MTSACKPLGRLAAAAGLLALAACNQVSYVDRGRTETVGKAQPDGDAFARQVDYHLTRAFYETPPDCVMVLPAKLPKGADPKLGARIGDAVSRHLTGHLDRVIGVRKLRAQARRRAFDPAHPEDLGRLARALRCDSVMEVETAGVDSFYAVVWANISVGLSLTLKRARDGQVLWRGAHTAERMDGGLPVSFLGAGAGMVSAGRLAGDADAVPSMIDDSLRRTLASLPDMRRN